MLEVLHLTKDLAYWEIFQKTVMHPSQIGATFLLLVSTIEEAIVLLIELLMTLVKVNHFVVDLRLEVVLFTGTKRLRFKEVVSDDGFPL